MHQTRATKLIKVTATLFMAGLAGPILLSAAGLSGNLSLSSFGTETVAVNGSDIDFDFSGTVSSGFPPLVTSGTVDGTGDSGLFEITNASNGSFGGAMIGTTTTVHDLSATMQPVGTTTSDPGSRSTSFITFTAVPGWNITLTEVNAGTDSTACNGSSGHSAHPPARRSIFKMRTAQLRHRVLVGFTFVGTATDGLGNTSSAVSGTFSTTFADTSYQAILADLFNAGDSIVSSAEATIGVTPITAAPEPASIYLLLVGSAMMMGSAAYRRRQRR